jgi:hypothetical protein
LGKKNERRNKSPKRAAKATRSSARMPMRSRAGIGLPTDPWWEEAFKLGVERVSAEAALNSLEEAKKEGIVGPKIYEKLKDVYLEKLSVIEHKQSTWHHEFPAFSEPPARRQMMNELTEAVARPYSVDSETSGKPGMEHVSSPQRLTTLGRATTAESRGPRKEFGPPGGAANPRRAMIDELKSVLSSAKPLQARAPIAPVSRRPAAPERRPTPLSEVPKDVEVPAPKEQILKAPNSSSAHVPSRLMELNREFLAEFKKLRQPDSLSK